MNATYILTPQEATVIAQAIARHLDRLPRRKASETLLEQSLLPLVLFDGIDAGERLGLFTSSRWPGSPTVIVSLRGAA
jgi:hypothetical protein